jgi:hypothetical protein
VKEMAIAYPIALALNYQLKLLPHLLALGLALAQQPAKNVEQNVSLLHVYQ